MLCGTILFKWILLFITTAIVRGKQQQSELCEAVDKSCRKKSPDECQMKYYKLNSTGCRDLTFSYNSVTTEGNIGTVKIEAYHYNWLSYKQTGFNVSFGDIVWSRMKFRFKQEGNELKNTCREFYMSENSTLKSFFYDCLWSNEGYEGKTFNFEYEMSTSQVSLYKKYTFRVPLSKNIEETTDLKNWEIFLFTEMFTNVFGLTTIILHWQPVPSRFSTNLYSVTVFSNDSGHPEVLFSTDVTCHSVEDCKFNYNKWHGSVQFGVQPLSLSNKSDFYMSKTIVFHLGSGNTQSLLIGIVSVTVIIPAFIYVLFLLRNHFVDKTKNWIYPVPKLLIIFTPSFSSHSNVVLALVEYLKKYCNVEPLVDELHILNSESRDPFKWCNEALKSAEFVMVVASPYHKNMRVSDSVYQSTDVLLLRLLQERLASDSRKTRVFVLMLPYARKEDVPEEAVHLRRYHFPKDLNKMLKFVHKDKLLPYYLNSKIQGGKRTYKMFGTKLKNCIKEAEEYIYRKRIELDEVAAETETREEKELSLEECLLKSPKTGKQISENGRIKDKKTVAEMAGHVFREFPGRLEDMNLSGDETESLVTVKRKSLKHDVVNLDTLDL